MSRQSQIAAIVLALAATSANAPAQTATRSGSTALPSVSLAAKSATQTTETKDNAAVRTIPRQVPAPAPAFVAPHGSWTRGPGTYSFKVCPTAEVSPIHPKAVAGAVCDIFLPSGRSVTVTIQAWGGGGGGGSGKSAAGSLPGGGGQGGGGGGYASLTQTIVAPNLGSVVWSVIVGAGGAGGSQGASGHNGGDSKVRANNSDIISANGGGLGPDGSFSSGIANGGHGWPTGSSGSNGTMGAHPDYGACAGGGGGSGGTGGGPGQINNGGSGGHGGYAHRIPKCTSEGLNNLLSPGGGGGNGRVTLTW